MAGTSRTSGWSLSGLLLGLTSCSSPFGSGESTYEGHYSFGFEASVFRGCNSTEGWWVDQSSGPIATYIEANADAFKSPDPLEPIPPGTIYVALQGMLSGPGEYGHWGTYRRQLVISEVGEVRMPRPDDCK